MTTRSGGSYDGWREQEPDEKNPPSWHWSGTDYYNADYSPLEAYQIAREVGHCHAAAEKIAQDTLACYIYHVNDNATNF